MDILLWIAGYLAIGVVVLLLTMHFVERKYTSLECTFIVVGWLILVPFAIYNSGEDEDDEE